ncbi:MULTISPECIES: ribokinase [unclassified Corallococcus]|uniref:ribokinase n=1 Tax=unclassified Corallococcus TaxID=2685029 RepID=UPI001A8E8E24|nr:MULTISPECIES: ribokinase [unclassified Corallococcus]MBN9680800.1 ribokinase [Corallococcus sp. NCSPR001]WAS87595.1 ribokinase [Corallococcus sp. NCRR]
MSPRIAVVGGVATDYLVHGRSFPEPGGSAEGDVFQEALGGKGANGAVAAVRLGARASLVARVGSDGRGLRQVAWLEREGVALEGVVPDAEAPSSAVLVMVDGHGRKQTFFSPGANHRLSIRDVLRSAERIATAKVLLVQLEVPLDAVQAAVRLARAAGVRVVLDPAPAVPLPEVLLEDVHVIRPNAVEARALTGIPVHGRASARRAARNLLLRGVGAAIIAAPGGSLLVSREEEAWLPELPVDTVDTTGAGDAFSAALCVALAEGQSLLSAARFAHAAAAIATTRLGTQAGLPYRDEVEGLLADVRPDVRPAPP